MASVFGSVCFLARDIHYNMESTSTLYISEPYRARVKWSCSYGSRQFIDLAVVQYRHTKLHNSEYTCLIDRVETCGVSWLLHSDTEHLKKIPM